MSRLTPLALFLLPLVAVSAGAADDPKALAAQVDQVFASMDSTVSPGAYRGLKTIDHGGADAGYRAELLRFPDRHFSVAVLCNLATADPGRLARRVADLYLEKDLAPKIEKSAPAAAVALPPERLAPFAGTYWNADEERALRVVLKGSALYGVAGGDELELRPTGEAAFDVVGAPVSVRFEGAGPGRPRLVVHPEGAPEPRVYEPVAEVQLTAKDLAAYAGDYRSAEIDPVFHLDVEGDQLVLKRLKSRPDPLKPLLADTFPVTSRLGRSTPTVGCPPHPAMNRRATPGTPAKAGFSRRLLR